MTPYHSKLWAHQLTRRYPPDSPERLAGTVAGARVDLNPHQVDAALFAFQSPLSRGALLADEVGLGKTIEAGLVLSQRWAERRRRLLVVTPSNLRKQWHQELTEKFFLPCEIFESRSYNQKLRAGNLDPLGTCDGIVICSYQFARAKADVVSRIPWDLVVMDEAHRLRNVYKKRNVVANTLKLALAQPQKLLLTATPLQNSLLELFGLVGFIDDYVFGDLGRFKALYSHPDEGSFEELRRRLLPVCHRTLRNQVRHYVPYTNRIPILEEFTPDEAEDRLYNLVSEYLRRPDLMALPSGQRTLIVLVMRKLLASSSFAIAGALRTMADRMRTKIARAEGSWQEEIGAEYEAMEATAEELDDDEEEEPLTPQQVAAMEKEIAELEGFASLASSIETNAKGQALVKALEVAFQKAEEIGALPKAVVFTESRKTQDYLLRVLADTPWGNGTILFNGTNTDARSNEIHTAWLERHKGTDLVTGSKSADMRAALVEEFRERGSILIATEAGAEGINLQFCSLVVNYDLPWNPQRIEQRIGRCHRYGQEHDVVVVNFLNSANEADQRVFKLLSDKFRLFEGVFGASDEILGAIESGVDFERRITGIYQDCRRPEEIREAFDRLQEELSPEIEEGMRQARRKLLENFDDEVRDKLRIRGEQSTEQLGRFERLLLALTRQELPSSIADPDDSGFELVANPFPDRDIPTGRYELPRHHAEAHAYRLGHPLAEAVLETAKRRSLPVGEIRFDLTGHPGKISVLEPWKGRSGSLVARRLSLEATAQAEDHLLIAGVSDEGDPLPPEALERIWSLSARLSGTLDHLDTFRLESLLEAQKQGILEQVQARNTRFLVEETEKLDTWAEDVKNALERDLKDLDREIREARKAAKQEATLEGKVAQQRRVKALETTRNSKRKALFEAQDEIDEKREAVLETVEAKLAQSARVEELFAVKWRIE